MTLDAGGTNFVFSAMRARGEIVDPVTLPANGYDLDACLKGIINGFSQVCDLLDHPPDAISFAFPGPADFPSGIIGNLTNLPAFRGGVALGPMLEDHFRIPVFINNDGDLFAYGEAIAGFLPSVNDELQRAGSPKRFRNLFGITLGTGFGGGIVHDGRLLLGDNSGGAELWAIRHKLDNRLPAEEGASIRGVRHVYAQLTGLDVNDSPKPKTIFEIANGQTPGDREAATRTLQVFGEVVGDAVASVTSLVDGLVVIGGGLAGAAQLFLPSMVAEMNGRLDLLSGATISRMEVAAYNLEDSEQKSRFLAGDPKQIVIPGSQRMVEYDAARRVGVGLSCLGTSLAVAIGAYAFALDALDRSK
ncbi:MAG: ROK family protein [bacterium]|nr:ROK family protein [bacterium]